MPLSRGQHHGSPRAPCSGALHPTPRLHAVSRSPGSLTPHGQVNCNQEPFSLSTGHWSDLHHPVLLSLNAPEQHVGEEAACTGPGMSRGGCRQGGSRTGRSVRPSAEALHCALMGEKTLGGKEADRDWIFLRNSVIHLLINNRHSQNVYQLQGGCSRTFTKPPLCPQGQPAANSHCFRMKPWRYIASRKTKSL